MSKPPGSRMAGRGTGPRSWSFWFRLDLLAGARGSAQPAWKGRSWLSQLVSGASGCVETTGQSNGGSDHRSPIAVALVSTRSARWRSRIGSTSFEGGMVSTRAAPSSRIGSTSFNGSALFHNLASAVASPTPPAQSDDHGMGLHSRMRRRLLLRRKYEMPGRTTSAAQRRRRGGLHETSPSGTTTVVSGVQ